MPTPDSSVDIFGYCQRIHKSIIGEIEQIPPSDLANLTIALIECLRSWHKSAAPFCRYDAAVQELICAVVFEAKAELAHPRQRKELKRQQANVLDAWYGPLRSRG